MITKRRLLSMLAAGPAALAAPSAWSQARTAAKTSASSVAWPTQPLKILVGFPPGSTPDLAARSISDALGRSIGQTVIVENRPGASGNIAADLVAKARDDHTIGVMINGNLTVAKLLNKALPFDPAKDFSP